MVDNIVEQVVTPVAPKVIPNEQLNIYVPTAGSDVPGLARFYDEHFTIVNGVVKIKPDYVKKVLAENFQPKYDENLHTTDKHITGAINEVLASTSQSIQNINTNVNDALDKSIKYIKYCTPELYKIKPLSVETVPSADESFEINGVTEYFNKDDEYKGEFTVDGLTAFLDEVSLEDSEKLFFTVRRPIKPSQYGGEIGFVMELPDNTFVEVLQMYLWGIYQDLTLRIYTSSTGEQWTYNEYFYPAQKGSNLNVYRYKVNKFCKYIKIVQAGEGVANYRYIVKGIELFKSTTEGYYDIIQRNGVISSFDTFDAAYLKERVDTGLQDISEATVTVGNFLNSVDKPGGFPQLDKNGKLPEKCIPYIAINDVITVTLTDSVSEQLINQSLIRIVRDNLSPAQIGDRVQFVTEEEIPSVDGGYITKQVAIRTYIYSSYADITEDTTDEEILNSWIVTGANYAVYSEHSNTCNKAADTTKVDGTLVRIGNIDTYNSLDVKNGVYIVTDYSEPSTESEF